MSIFAQIRLEGRTRRAQPFLRERFPQFLVLSTGWFRLRESPSVGILEKLQSRESAACNLGWRVLLLDKLRMSSGASWWAWSTSRSCP
jgi:hypothetical protein